MQLPTDTDTHSDSTLRGCCRRIVRHVGDSFDAARRRATDRIGATRAAFQRHLRANSLVHIHEDRISVGIRVDDLGLSRIEPADTGA